MCAYARVRHDNVLDAFSAALELSEDDVCPPIDVGDVLREVPQGWNGANGVQQRYKSAYVISDEVMVEIVWSIEHTTHVISYGAWMSTDEVFSILTFDQNVEGKKECTTVENRALSSLPIVSN